MILVNFKSILLIILIILIYIQPINGYSYTNTEIVNAIYKAENSKKYPYGIKSINTHSNKDYARKICFNTVKNNRLRFSKQTKYNDFIEFLSIRYSRNHYKQWMKNVKFFLKTQNSVLKNPSVGNKSIK